MHSRTAEHPRTAVGFTADDEGLAVHDAAVETALAADRPASHDALPTHGPPEPAG